MGTALAEWRETKRSHTGPRDRDLADFLARPDGMELVVELAHDLRSPLTSIVCLAEVLEGGQSGPVSDLQRRQLGLIRAAALSMCTTASDVIESARRGVQLVNQEAEPFSVAEMFASVQDIVGPVAEGKGLELRFEALEPDRRLGHPRAISRVLLNLTTNALKFTDQGFVEIAAWPKGNRRTEFSVRDTGSGIDPAALRSRYQPFRRSAGNGRHRFSSSGLGLGICRKLLTAMGSALELETRAGRGSRFFFELELPPCTARAAAGQVFEDSFSATTGC